MSKILAIIPAYNEASHIRQVVLSTLKFLPVLVVDDCSSDLTAQIAKNAGAMILKQKPNQGKGAALRAGFERAIESGYQAVITLDGDGQHNPEEIPTFISEYQKQLSLSPRRLSPHCLSPHCLSPHCLSPHCLSPHRLSPHCLSPHCLSSDTLSLEYESVDLIIGARQFDQMPVRRRIPNTLGLYLFSWAVGQHIRDNQSGYRLLSQRLMRRMLDSRENGFEFELEMIIQTIQHCKTEIKWVSCQTIYQGETSHIKPLQHLSNFLKTCWRARRTIKSHQNRQCNDTV